MNTICVLFFSGAKLADGRLAVGSSLQLLTTLYECFILMFLLPLAASASLILNGITSVLFWLLLPAYAKILGWSAYKVLYLSLC